jgi:hypothetical protein
MDTYKDKTSLLLHIAEFFLEKETFPKDFVDKMKKGILC